MDSDYLKAVKVHGRRWMNMLVRCYDPECPAYPNYGARGISVCREWWTLDGFIAGLPQGHFKGAEIDRIDNNGDYSPSNVRWATHQQNSANRRSAHLITFDGRTQSLGAWSLETGIKSATISTRMSDSGWSVERALTTRPMSARERMSLARSVKFKDYIPPETKPRREVRKYTLDGRELSLGQVAGIVGVSVQLLRKRIHERGWDFERAIDPEKFPTNAREQSRRRVCAEAKRERSRMKMSDAALLARANLADAKRGVRRTEETKAKISAAQKGRVLTDAHRAAISGALKGRAKSPEHNAKVSAALTGKPGTRLGVTLSEETKQRMREAQLLRLQKIASEQASVVLSAT